MARIRTIKPTFWVSAQVVECSIPARLLFIGLWTFCDDRGVHPANVKSLKMEVFPGDDIPLDDIRRMVGELSANGLINYFEADGAEYWYVTGWAHQKIEKPNNRYPNPLDYQHSSNSRRLVGEYSATILPRKGEEGIVRDSIGIEPPLPPKRGEVVLSQSSAFDDFWQAYPAHRRLPKKKCLEVWGRKKLDSQAADVLHGLAQWVASAAWQEAGGQYIPQALTFLNQERWRDVPAAQAAAAVAQPMSFGEAGALMAAHYQRLAEEEQQQLGVQANG